MILDTSNIGTLKMSFSIDALLSNHVSQKPVSKVSSKEQKMEDPVGLPQSAVPKHRPEKNHRDRPAAPLGLLPRAPATGVPLVPSLVSLPPIL